RGNSTSRPAAAYASTASGHGHTMAMGDTASDPFSRSAQNEARRDPSRSTGTPRSCPAHSRAGKPHRQTARPGTRPGRSDSQAVNSPPPRDSRARANRPGPLPPGAAGPASGADQRIAPGLVVQVGQPGLAQGLNG